MQKKKAYALYQKTMRSVSLYAMRLQYRTSRSDHWHIVALRDVVRHDSLQIPQGHSVYFDYD